MERIGHFSKESGEEATSIGKERIPRRKQNRDQENQEETEEDQIDGRRRYPSRNAPRRIADRNSVSDKRSLLVHSRSETGKR